MLTYLVTSATRRRLLELLWRHDASGSATDLAKRAHLSFGAVYRELQAMKRNGLASAAVVDGREVYRAAGEHPDADLVRRLVTAKSSAPMPEDADLTRRRARALGAPLAVHPQRVEPADRELAIVDAVHLARRDATLARVMPVALWRQRDALDRPRLRRHARAAHESHATGFMLALTSELSGDASLDTWAEELRDHRARGTRPFFELPATRSARQQAERRTPAVARRWGYLLDLDLASFQSAFDKVRTGA